MANINIYGTLFSNLSELNDKVIVLGSQVYGNGVEVPGSSSEEGSIFTNTELRQMGTTWTTNIVPGNQYDINRIFKLKINGIESSISSINTNISNIKSNYLPLAGGTMVSGAEIKSTGLIIRATELILGTTVDGVIQLGEGLDREDIFVHSDMHQADDKWHIYKTGNINAEKFVLNNKHVTTYSTATWDSAYLLTNDTSNSSVNCIKLGSVISSIPISIGHNTGPISNHLSTLYNKVNHITQPLRFKGVINTGGKLPISGMEIGDVYHFNADVDPYNIGDEVVYVGNTPGVESPWELLGQNITPIPTGSITFENLESN